VGIVRLACQASAPCKCGSAGSGSVGSVDSIGVQTALILARETAVGIYPIAAYCFITHPRTSSPSKSGETCGGSQPNWRIFVRMRFRSMSTSGSRLARIRDHRRRGRTCRLSAAASSCCGSRGGSRQNEGGGMSQRLSCCCLAWNPTGVVAANTRRKSSSISQRRGAIVFRRARERPRRCAGNQPGVAAGCGPACRIARRSQSR